MTNVRSLGSDLVRRGPAGEPFLQTHFSDSLFVQERHTHLVALQERNQRLFYATLVAHPEELKPIIYSPTVGLACQRFGLLFRRPRGLFVSSADRGRVYQLLKNWPERQARAGEAATERGLAIAGRPAPPPPPPHPIPGASVVPHRRRARAWVGGPGRAQHGGGCVQGCVRDCIWWRRPGRRPAPGAGRGHRQRGAAGGPFLRGAAPAAGPGGGLRRAAGRDGGRRQAPLGPHPGAAVRGVL